MKKIALYIFAAAAAVFALSCQRESDLPVEENALVSVAGPSYHAVIAEGETKAFIGTDSKVYWNSGDAISLFSTTYNWKYTFQGNDGDREGIFSPEPIDPQYFIAANQLDVDAVYAVYPYVNEVTTFNGTDAEGVEREFGALYGNKIGADGTLSVTIPTVQRYVPGKKVSPETNVMVAVTKNADDKFLAFKNVCGYLSIPMYGSARVSSISLYGNGKYLAGTYYVKASAESDPVITQDYNVYGTVELYADEPVALSENTPTEFCFALRPGQFANGFVVSVYLDDGTVQNFYTDKDRVIKRNTFYTMDPIEVNASEYVYYADPVTGSTVFTFNEYWWGDVVDVTIKYKEIDNARYCIAETLDGSGIWGDEVGTTFEFVWYLDKYDNYGRQVIDIPVQYVGYDYNDGSVNKPYEEAVYPIMISDSYQYFYGLDYVSGTADEFYAVYGNRYPRSYYDPRGKFSFNAWYYIVDMGLLSTSEESAFITSASYRNRDLYGIYISKSTPENLSVHVSAGSYIGTVLYYVVDGTPDTAVVQSLLDQMLSGTLDCEGMYLRNDGDTNYANIDLSDLAPGDYTLIVAAYDYDGVYQGSWSLACTRIEETWTSLGTCSYTDDFLSTFGNGTYTWDVEVMQSNVYPGRIKMLYPYSHCPLVLKGEWSTEKDYDIIITIADESHVYIEPQETGVDKQEGMMSIATQAGYYISLGYSIYLLDNAGIEFGYVSEDGVIGFPARTGLVSMADKRNGEWLAANSYGALSLVLPAGVTFASAAPAPTPPVKPSKASRLELLPHIDSL